MKDWLAWHAGYDDPSSSLSVRLRLVRAHLSRALETAPPGPVRLLSLCAGQGHDVLGVLPGHPRAPEVSVVLVERDSRNAALARRRADQAGLAQVEVREADAALVAGYADALPAGVLLLCGIFGNVNDADIRRTARAAPALCAPGATVIWTRHRRPRCRTARCLPSAPPDFMPYAAPPAPSPTAHRAPRRSRPRPGSAASDHLDGARCRGRPGGRVRPLTGRAALRWRAAVARIGGWRALARWWSRERANNERRARQ